MAAVPPAKGRRASGWSIVSQVSAKAAVISRVRRPTRRGAIRRMYSVKPGRGPSFAGGVVGIFFVIFGICFFAWIPDDSPGFIRAFLIFWILAAAFGVFYNFYNATQPNRVSEVDIVRSGSGPDPVASAFGHVDQPPAAQTTAGGDERSFCPYCGSRLGGG